MNIYHYSVQDYPVLLTVNKQKEAGMQVARPSGVSGDYDNHISFFFDTVPLDILGGIFGPEHRLWYPGSRVVEYAVDPADIEQFHFEIVESPEQTKLLYDTSLSDEQYNVRLKEAIEKHGYKGHGYQALVKASRKLIGTTRKAYEQLPQRPNWAKIKHMYAASVPHVMLYPADGTVRYRSKRHLKVK